MGCSDNAAPTTQNENILPEYALKYARLDQYGRSAVEAITWQNITDAAAKTPCVLQRHTPVIFLLKEKL